jgi:Cft2 family RNA processing exonuclease
VVPLPIELRPAGLYLPTLELHLDPRSDVPSAFVSHAHFDHAGAHAREALTSYETRALVEARREVPLSGDVQIVPWDGFLERRMTDGATARLSIAPAGHVLGAAQLVIDHPGGRFVYTGDYQSGPAATHAEGKPVACDELVIETTFGLPMFRFPDRAETLETMATYCDERIEAGETPVVVAYALGKAQEIARALTSRGIPVVAHGATMKVCRAYEALGVKVGVSEGLVRAYADEKKEGRAKADSLGAALLVPPGSGAMFRKRRSARVAYVSGWAVLDAAVERQRADAAFALSDHADHDDLVATVAWSGARVVYATHGDDASVFASLLRKRGIDARPLELASLDGHDDATTVDEGA